LGGGRDYGHHAKLASKWSGIFDVSCIGYANGRSSVDYLKCHTARSLYLETVTVVRDGLALTPNWDSCDRSQGRRRLRRENIFWRKKSKRVQSKIGRIVAEDMKLSFGTFHENLRVGRGDP